MVKFPFPTGSLKCAMSVVALPGRMLGARSRVRHLSLSSVGWCESCNNNNNNDNNNGTTCHNWCIRPLADNTNSVQSLHVFFCLLYTQIIDQLSPTWLVVLRLSYTFLEPCAESLLVTHVQSLCQETMYKEIHSWTLYHSVFLLDQE